MSDVAGQDPSTTPHAADDPPHLEISVVDLRRRLGQRHVEPIEVVLAPRRVIDSQIAAEPVRGELTIESIERGVSVTGPVRFRWEGDCRRCLEPTGGEMEIWIDEIFQIDAPEDGDINDFDGEHLDLLPIVADAVALSLPLAPLCSDDCAGPDPDRYPAITYEQAEAARKAKPDPRWAALESLGLDGDDEQASDN